ncbi:MAG TPA: protein kinase [Kofleriaceae bacterium]|nr:protein kinase [Kofleriaceae bacterium]
MSSDRDPRGGGTDEYGRPPGVASATRTGAPAPAPGGWRRLISWLRGEGATDHPLLSPGEAPPEPALLGVKEELWLGQLAEDAAEGRRLDAVAGEEFMQHIDSLWRSGHERLSLQWLAKFIAMPAVGGDRAVTLRLRLVDLCDRRGQLGEAVGHLEALAAVDDHAARAHFLLAEHHRRTGDETGALRHYEAVLARDVDYPNARVRLDRLRAQRGVSAPASLGATIAGAAEMPGTGGSAAGARYALMREIGRGATGVVYLARDRELDRDVAVKLLHPHLASAARAEACARFFAEARLAASLRHPNIVAILDLDETARRIVMELAAGGTMREVLRERGPRHLRRALDRQVQILSALLAAHRRGIVHRDLKPANLMFRRDADAPGSEIMLGDFGVAHLPAAEAPRGGGEHTAEHARRQRDAVGTLAYMAPEQRKAGEANPRSDLYSSAVVLYEMLTCRFPWPPHVLLGGARRRGDFLLPSQLRERGPAELLAEVQKLLDDLGDPDPAMRPDTADALARASGLRDRAVAECSP